MRDGRFYDERTLVLRYLPPGRSSSRVDEWPATRGEVPEWEWEAFRERLRTARNDSRVLWFDEIAGFFLRFYLVPGDAEMVLECYESGEREFFEVRKREVY